MLSFPQWVHLIRPSYLKAHDLPVFSSRNAWYFRLHRYFISMHCKSKFRYFKIPGFNTLKYENIDISINIDTSILMRKKINIYKIVNGKIMFEIIPISNFFMKKSFPSKRTIFKQFFELHIIHIIHLYIIFLFWLIQCRFVIWWQMQLANSNELIDWLVNRNWLN